MSDKSDVQRITKLITLYLEDRITAGQEYTLDAMLLEERGLTKQLVEWVRVGAERKHPLYQALFGQMLLHEWGVTKNWKEAALLFHLSHEQGCTKGTYWYSKCLLSGWGVACNSEEAVRLLRAQRGAYGPEGASRAARYAQEACVAHAKRQDARVTYKLAWCYLVGEGVAPNKEEAARLYLEAAHLGYSHAMYEAGVCFHYGEGVERDVVEAARWFRRAAALGDGFAPGQLKQIQEEDAEAVNPYGEWEPRWEVHQWVSQKVHQEMMSALLVCKRLGIPNVVAVHCLLPFICSLPRSASTL